VTIAENHNAGSKETVRVQDESASSNDHLNPHKSPKASSFLAGVIPLVPEKGVLKRSPNGAGLGAVAVRFDTGNKDGAPQTFAFSAPSGSFDTEAATGEDQTS
jgi:hypothetical protein